MRKKIFCRKKNHFLKFLFQICIFFIIRKKNYIKLFFDYFIFFFKTQSSNKITEKKKFIIFSSPSKTQINIIPQPHGKTTAVILALCPAQQRADQSY